MKEVKVECVSNPIHDKYNVTFVGLTEYEFQILKDAIEVYSVNARVYSANNGCSQGTELNRRLQEARPTVRVKENF